MDEIQQIKFRCADLAQKLTANDPSFKNLLKEIHDNILKTPELMYALSDEEISQVVAGLSKFTGVEISQAHAKEPLTKKKLANLTADDV